MNIYDIQKCGNENYYRVYATWVPHGKNPTWAAVHWKVVPQEWRDYADGKADKPKETKYD